MDLRKLEKLISLVEGSGIVKIEVTEGEEEVRITRATAAQPVFATPTAIAPVATAPVAAAPAPVISAVPAVCGLSNAQKSPMVSTFYRAPNPNASALVEIGRQARAGDILCTVEAVKLMNEVRAEKSGVIKEILVDNSTSVKYGEPLFIIE